MLDMATAFNSPPGQNHDRFDSKDELSIRNMLPTQEDLDGSNDPADITPVQKMLSATTGSLITGLTSMQHTFRTLARKLFG